MEKIERQLLKNKEKLSGESYVHAHLQVVQWTDGGRIELIDAGSSTSME